MQLHTAIPEGDSVSTLKGGEKKGGTPNNCGIQITEKIAW